MPSGISQIQNKEYLWGHHQMRSRRFCDHSGMFLNSSLLYINIHLSLGKCHSGANGQELACHYRRHTRPECELMCQGSSLGEGNGNRLQYSCLDNPRDRGVWHAVHWVTKRWTWPKGLSMHSRTHVSVPLSQIIPPFRSPTVSKYLFSISASPLLPCR